MEVEIDYTPRDAVVDRFHARTERTCYWIAHRRRGKTVAIANDGYRRLVDIPIKGREHAPPKIAWMYPTRVRAKDIAWSYLKYFTRKIPGARPIESELAIEFADGRRFTLYGADGHRGVGQYLDGIYYDERDDIPDKVVVDLAPTLSDYKGFEVHAGMLRGRYLLWKLREGSLGDPGVLNIMERASETNTIPADELVALRKKMGEAAYEMQMECNPNASIANAIYGREMDKMRRENRIQPKLAVDPAAALYAFADIGHSLTGDDWSWWFVQLSGRDMLIHEYYARTGEMPAHYAAKILEVQDRLGVRVTLVCLPHDGARKDRHGMSAKDDLEAAGLLGRVRIVDRTPNVWDSINDVRAVLPQCYISQAGCGEGWTLGEMEMPSGIDCLDYYTKKVEAQTGLIREEPVHNQYSHGADAFRTFVEAMKRGLLEGRSVMEQNMRNTKIEVNREAPSARRKILVNR